MIGCIGEDPVTAWSKTANGVTVSTENRSLFRKSTVTSGVTTNPSPGTFDLSAEWGLNYTSALPTAPFYSLGVAGQTTTLAVTLVAFNAISTERGNKILWSTSSENNNSYFEILASYDGILFESLGKVNGSINSNTTNNYAFTDNRVQKSGSVYYKLKQVDLNGVTNFYGPKVVVNSMSKGQQLFLSGDGNQVKLSIISDREVKTKLCIYNTQGVKLFNQNLLLLNGLTETPLPLSIQGGMYILTIQGAGINLVQKFIL